MWEGVKGEGDGCGAGFRNMKGVIECKNCGFQAQSTQDFARHCKEAEVRKKQDVEEFEKYGTMKGDRSKQSKNLRRPVSTPSFADIKNVVRSIDLENIVGEIRKKITGLDLSPSEPKPVTNSHTSHLPLPLPNTHVSHLPLINPCGSPQPPAYPNASHLPLTKPYVSHLPLTKPYASPLPLTKPSASHLPLTKPHTSHLPLTKPSASHLPLTKPSASHLPKTKPHTSHLPLTKPSASHLPLTKPNASHLPLTKPRGGGSHHNKVHGSHFPSSSVDGNMQYNSSEGLFDDRFHLQNYPLPQLLSQQAAILHQSGYGEVLHHQLNVPDEGVVGKKEEILRLEKELQAQPRMEEQERVLGRWKEDWERREMEMARVQRERREYGDIGRSRQVENIEEVKRMEREFSDVGAEERLRCDEENLRLATAKNKAIEEGEDEEQEKIREKRQEVEREREKTELGSRQRKYRILDDEKGSNDIAISLKQVEEARVEGLRKLTKVAREMEEKAIWQDVKEKVEGIVDSQRRECIILDDSGSGYALPVKNIRIDDQKIVNGDDIFESDEEEENVVLCESLTNVKCNQDSVDHEQQLIWDAIKKRNESKRDDEKKLGDGLEHNDVVKDQLKIMEDIARRNQERKREEELNFQLIKKLSQEKGEEHQPRVDPVVYPLPGVRESAGATSSSLRVQVPWPGPVNGAQVQETLPTTGQTHTSSSSYGNSRIFGKVVESVRSSEEVVKFSQKRFEGLIIPLREGELIPGGASNGFDLAGEEKEVWKRNEVSLDDFLVGRPVMVATEEKKMKYKKGKNVRERRLSEAMTEMELERKWTATELKERMDAQERDQISKLEKDTVSKDWEQSNKRSQRTEAVKIEKELGRISRPPRCQHVATDPVKKLRNFRKKLRYIEALEAKLDSGEIPCPEQAQLDKVARKMDVIRKISALEAARVHEAVSFQDCPNDKTTKEQRKKKCEQFGLEQEKRRNKSGK